MISQNDCPAEILVGPGEVEIKNVGILVPMA
jgi:hypothetical protein